MMGKASFPVPVIGLVFLRESFLWLLVWFLVEHSSFRKEVYFKGKNLLSKEQKSYS